MSRSSLSLFFLIPTVWLFIRRASHTVHRRISSRCSGEAPRSFYVFCFSCNPHSPSGGVHEDSINQSINQPLPAICTETWTHADRSVHPNQPTRAFKTPRALNLSHQHSHFSHTTISSNGSPLRGGVDAPSSWNAGTNEGMD